MMDPRQHHAQAPATRREMHLCTACSSPHVQPVEWQEGEGGSEGGSWEVELRCPDCEHRVHDTYTQREIDDYDRLLEDGIRELAGDLRNLTRENMEHEAGELAAALAADFILPEDF